MGVKKIDLIVKQLEDLCYRCADGSSSDPKKKALLVPPYMYSVDNDFTSIYFHWNETRESSNYGYQYIWRKGKFYLRVSIKSLLPKCVSDSMGVANFLVLYNNTLKH